MFWYQNNIFQQLEYLRIFKITAGFKFTLTFSFDIPLIKIICESNFLQSKVINFNQTVILDIPLQNQIVFVTEIISKRNVSTLEN